MRRLPQLISLVALLLLPAMHAQAQEFRLLNRIPTPTAAQRLPEGARMVAASQPIAATEIESAVRQIAASWGKSDLEPLLADNFNDKSRLLGTLAADVPRDAGLRVVSIQGSQILTQYTMADTDGQQSLYSRVSVTVRTQVEYNDAQKGFQRLDGTNDLILLIKGAAP